MARIVKRRSSSKMTGDAPVIPDRAAFVAREFWW
jgi:hypothetical protein